MSKKNKMLFLDDEVYKKFQIYAIMINSNVSKEVEKFMKDRVDSIEQFKKKNWKK